MCSQIIRVYCSCKERYYATGYWVPHVSNRLLKFVAEFGLMVNSLGKSLKKLDFALDWVLS